MRTGVIVSRLVIAAGLVVAIVAQLIASIGFAGRDGSPDTGTVIINYLSYFTIDSNTLSVVVLTIGAVLLLRGVEVEPRGFTVVRAAVATYMIITGVVYNLLLRNGLPQGATVGWSNEILHVVGPLYLLLDWWFAPGRARLPWRAALWALVFPVVWAIYTLVRGPFATDPYLHTAYWYPYPFLNPVTSPGGYVSVAGYVVGIAAVVIVVAFGLTWTSRRGRPYVTAPV